MSKQILINATNMQDGEYYEWIHCLSAEEFRKALIVALKEQDRDTRHACAEAVNSIDGEIANDGIRDLIDQNEAHNVIMNCNNGLKNIA